jgi:putative endonuclease
MATHNDLGKNGEKLAKEYFEKNNYEILHLNWRHSHYEVDIIAGKNNVLHFIEVKSRRSKAFGNPEESVTKKKIENLMHAAEEFLYQFPQWKRIQFNILSINIINDKPEFFLIEDVSL